MSTSDTALIGNHKPAARPFSAIPLGRKFLPHRNRFINVGFSQRETQILQLIAAGNQIKEVARWLGISPSTVRFFLKKARYKLGAKNTLHAVVITAAKQLIDLNEIIAPVEGAISKAEGRSHD